MCIRDRVFPARGAAQAFVADQLGDSTGRYNGYMTMKPLVHISWIGLITLYAVGLPLIEPVPIMPRNFRKPRSGYIMSILAGPISGLLIAALAVGIYRICLLMVPSFSILLILRDLLLGCFAQNCVYLTCLLYTSVTGNHIGVNVGIIPQPGGENRFQKTVGGIFFDQSARAGFRDLLAPVSYTHLDVYKRQAALYPADSR